MRDTQSDALVFFGATGDLAYKKIFPSLQAMAKRGDLNVPVIGVAKAGWNLDQLRARAQESVEKYGGLDRDAFATLSGLLRYVDGDYKDPATFEALRRELGGAEHPAHYLAIPPPLFGPVVEQLARSGCAKGARVVVEKPFGEDLASARELNRILLGTFVEADIFRIDHYLGKRPVHNMLFSRFSNPVLEAFWNRTLRRERADHDGGGLRHPGARRLLRRDRRDPRRRPEPPLPAVEQSRDGAAGANGQRVAAGRKGESPEGHSRLCRPTTSFAGSSAATARSQASPPIRRSRPTPPCGCASSRCGGRAFRSTSAQGSASPSRPRKSSSACGGRPTAVLFPNSAPLSNYFRFQIIPRQTVAFGVTAMDEADQMIGQRAELVASRQPGADEKAAYERVLTDALAGDATLFARMDYVEEAWRIVDPVLAMNTPVREYEPGTWGPEDASVVPPGGWANPTGEPVLAHV